MLPVMREKAHVVLAVLTGDRHELIGAEGELVEELDLQPCLDKRGNHVR